jgi:hypothetical protein
MSESKSDRPVYDALAIPNEAIANGGTEILRAGVVDDELFVTARHAFKDPAQWGEVLADITRRLALLYSMETDLSEEEALAEIEEAYAADMGAREVPEQGAVGSASSEAGTSSPQGEAGSAAQPSAPLRKKRPTPPTEAGS